MNTPLYSAFLDRLAYFIEQEGLSLNKFGEQAGFANGGINRVLRDKANFGVDKLLTILACFPRLSTDWLLRGNGAMQQAEEEVAQEEQVDVFMLIGQGYSQPKEKLIGGLMQLAKEREDLMKQVIRLSQRVTEMESDQQHLQQFLTDLSGKLGLDPNDATKPS